MWNAGIKAAIADVMENVIADTIGTFQDRMDALKRARCVRRYLYHLLFEMIPLQYFYPTSKSLLIFTLSLFRTRLRLIDAMKHQPMNYK